MFFGSSILNDLLGLFIALIAITIAFYKWRFQSWKKKNVPYLEPSIPFGSLGNPVKRTKSFGDSLRDIYDDMKSKGWRHGGLYLFASPTYFVVDIEYVKNIMQKDFHHFVDRGVYYNEKVDPLSAHLFAIGGTKWRNLRTKLTPTFTSGKMKMMFQTLVDCEANLEKVMKKFCDNHEAIDIKEVLGCFTTDIIGSCAFGLDFNTFQEQNSPFRVYGKKVFITSTRDRLKVALVMNIPILGQLFGLRLTPKEVSDFFMKVIKDNVNYRERNNIVQKDFMQLLIDLKNNKLAEEDSYKHDGKSLTMDEVAAQCFVFFLAGFETSSTTMTFALYELARHQDIQDKVRQEIEEVLSKHGGKITYEAIQDMKYMQQVIDETLRKYPPVPFVTRKCVEDYKIPDQDIIIDKGTRVMISILGIHRDPEYYPDPEKFDPERFSEENKHTRHQFAHIPFGEGPRICIGMRFGLMQSKVGLTSLLKTYRFTVNKKTKEPLQFQKDSFVLAAQGEVWLDAHKL